MFFYAAKIIGYFLQPVAIIASLLILGIIAKLINFKKIGSFLSGSGLVLFFMIIFTPISNMALIPLEVRFPPPNPPKEIAGIIVLGGMIDGVDADVRLSLSYTEAADRLIVGTFLAKNRYPNAPLIFTGGSNAVVNDSEKEADIAEIYFQKVGMDPSRLHFENQSRNTYENAIFSKPIAEALEQKATVKNLPWVLVTSASHMPRSVGNFRAAGWENIVPWPVDYLTKGEVDLFTIPRSMSGAISNISLASREWTGLAAYWLTGRTDEFFPGPDAASTK